MENVNNWILVVLGLAGLTLLMSRNKKEDKKEDNKQFKRMEEFDAPLLKDEIKEFISNNFKFFDLEALRENTKKARNERYWNRFPSGLWSLLEKPFSKSVYCAMIIDYRPYEVLMSVGENPSIAKYYEHGERSEGENGCGEAQLLINETGIPVYFKVVCSAAVLPAKARKEFNKIPLKPQV